MRPLTSAEHTALDASPPWKGIPGFFDFDDIYQAAIDEAKNADAFVEVGAWHGRSTAWMADEIRKSDKWIRFSSYDLFVPLHGGEDAATLEGTQRNMGPLLGRYVNLEAMPSVEAANLHRDSSLALVFLDGDHRYEGILADIKAWLPKVRPGGTLAGHDFFVFPDGVGRAVREVFGPSIETSKNSWIVKKAP